MISKSILNEIRDRISITAFIGERIPLKKAGRNFKGRCPFHNEKTPSFNVSDDKQIYHCFGCNEGGDIFDFVMKFDGLSFAEAARYLAGIAGVEIPRDERPADRGAEEQEAKKKRWAYRANEIARDFFSESLKDASRGVPARKYLQHRGISEEFWTQHFLGYADNSWESLIAHLKEKGVPLDLAAELGLLKRKDDGGYFDFFRSRLMFPIVSPRGEILGFGGRALEDEKDGERVAKYMNSPDSLIYHKSNCVYGLDKASSAIRNDGFVILVEGYMDLIALHQYGIKNVVAPLGTALTQGHLRLVGRYSKEMVLLFDGDEAGVRAALRSLELFIEFGSMPRVVPLPEGHDPDSLIRMEGDEKFRVRLKNAKSLFEFFIDWTVRETGLDAAGKVKAVSKVVPYLKMMADPVERGVYIRAAAARMGVDQGDIEKSVGSSKRQPEARVARMEPSAKDDRHNDVPSSAERTLVRIMLARPESIAVIFERLAPEDFRDGWCRTVAEVLYGPSADGRELNIGHMLNGIQDPELAAQLRAMAVEGCGCDDEDVEDLIADCIGKLHRRPKMERLEAINDDIRRAETDGDEKRLFELLEEKRGLALEKHGA